ncbi:hypothetical protein [Planktomarina temperata]|uniref:Uncharacterized protein n=1 Tax=Planktomarina temperata RCA23 TaxID=666509 RepID=A0AAN0RL37_9RHOB|nr:hypothetical protein RCA23_c26380 [Planktomarina temperata RCA23]
MAARSSIFWLIVSLSIAASAGYFAFCDAEKFAGVIDLLATIVSILIGVSLAVIAVLSSPFSVTQDNAKDSDEASRMTKLVKQDDEDMALGQLMLFRIYYLALFLALAFKWLTAGETTDFDELHIRILASATAAIGILTFCWSARLPLMLQRISNQRRSLGS